MKVYKSFLLIPFLIAFIAMPFAQASPDLNVTVTIDKPYYIPEETVNVNGTLTRNYSPVEGGLVAIQIEDPNNYSVVVRTQQTGTNSTTGLIEIIGAIPSDPTTGEPKSSFDIGELFGLKVTVNNTDFESHFVRVIINAYDASGVTLGTSAGIGTVHPGERFFIIAIPIPITAYTGNATAYASVYTDWPKNGGVPYGPEVSASFEIVGSGVQGSADSETQSSTPGTYDITLKLPTNAKTGTYTAYATSSYAGENDIASTTFNFEVAIPIVVPQGTFHIVLETNSTLYNLSTFKFNKTFTRDGRSGELSFTFTGFTGFTSFFRLKIPKGLWTGNPWQILIDDNQVSTFDVSDIGDINIFDFNYLHTDTGTHTLQIYGTWVVPEFPTSTLLPLLIIATLAAAILAQKTRLTKRRKTAAVG